MAKKSFLMKPSLFLVGSFFLLLILFCFLWVNRYEAKEDSRVLELNDLAPLVKNVEGVRLGGSEEDPFIVISRNTGAKPVSLLLKLPGITDVDTLHLSYEILMKDLVPGLRPWDKGRLAMQWVGGNEKNQIEYDPIHDFDGDGNILVESRVVFPAAAPAHPVIQIQHHGVSGTFVLRRLEVLVVSERNSWPYFRWAMAGLSFVWIACFFYFSIGCRLSYALIGGAVSLLMLQVLIIPDSSRILPQWWGMKYSVPITHETMAGKKSESAEPFVVDAEEELGRAFPKVENPAAVDQHLSEQAPVESESEEEESEEIRPSAHVVMKSKPGWIPWLKTIVRQYPMGLHIIAFAIASFLFSLLFDPRWSIGITLFFAVGSEGMQILTGNDFDFSDTIDLAMNLTGGCIGLLFAGGLKGRLFS